MCVVWGPHLWLIEHAHRSGPQTRVCVVVLQTTSNAANTSGSIQGHTKIHQRSLSAAIGHFLLVRGVIKKMPSIARARKSPPFPS